MHPPWGHSCVTSGFLLVAETINFEVFFALWICWFENRTKFSLSVSISNSLVLWMRAKVRAFSGWALLVSLQGFRRSIPGHDIPISQQTDFSLCLALPSLMRREDGLRALTPSYPLLAGVKLIWEIGKGFKRMLEPLVNHLNTRVCWGGPAAKSGTQMDHNVINLSTVEQTSLFQPVMTGRRSRGSWELMGLGWDEERGQPGI